MKRIAAIICAASLVFLTSCNGKAGEVFSAVYDVFVKSDNEYIDEAIKTIITAAQEDKPEVIEALFSKTAQKEADDISEKSKEVADIFKDTVTYSPSKGLGNSAESSYDHGKWSRLLCGKSYVYKDDAVYRMVIELCIHDDFDEDNIGLKSIHIVSMNLTDDEIAAAYNGFDYGIRIVGAAE